MSTDSIEREVTIEAPVERVWSLITEAEHLGVWFGDAGATVDLRPGGEIEFVWREDGSAFGTVVAVERPRRFAYRWISLTSARGQRPTADNATLVEFTLEPVGEGTLVRVVESGFDALACSDEERAEALAGNTRGWGMELGELVDYAERVAA
jgi:uncharacterized protein YndB with AHSA1/START domain